MLIFFGKQHWNMAKHTSVHEQGVAIKAPRRFKSAFICYSSERHKEIREELAERGLKEKVSRSNKNALPAWLHVHHSRKHLDDKCCQNDLKRMARNDPGRTRVLGRKEQRWPESVRRGVDGLPCGTSTTETSPERSQRPPSSHVGISGVLESTQGCSQTCKPLHDQCGFVQDIIANMERVANGAQERVYWSRSAFASTIQSW